MLIVNYSLTAKPEDEESWSSTRPLIGYDASDAEDILTEKFETARDFLKGNYQVLSPHSSDDDLPSFSIDQRDDLGASQFQDQSQKGGCCYMIS